MGSPKRDGRAPGGGKKKEEKRDRKKPRGSSNRKSNEGVTRFGKKDRRREGGEKERVQWE